MSIKKQFCILSALIITIPFLCCLFTVIYRYITSSNRMIIHGYKEIRSIATTTISETEWNQIAKSLRILPPDVDALIVEETSIKRNFRVLFSTIPEFEVNQELNTRQIWKHIEEKSSEYFYQFASPALKAHPIIMISRIPHQKQEPRKRLGLFNQLLIFLIALVTVLVFYIVYFSKNIFSSISLIEKSALQMAAGDISTEINQEINKQKQNEITSINSSLEIMRKALVEAQNKKNRFIMGISHDLRTPVAIIKGYTEALSDEIITEEEEKKQTYNLISSKTNQLDSMITTLINYTKLESTDLRDKLHLDSISDLIVEFAKEAKITSTVYHRNVTTDINLPQDIKIKMDKQLILRAFENLFINALRYTKDNDNITIRAFTENDNLYFSISDTGCGINKKDLSHIFDLFYRGTNSRKEEGMGIGLSVVKNIIDTHGWKIEVSSEEKKGTCFTVTIPYKQ